MVNNVNTENKSSSWKYRIMLNRNGMHAFFPHSLQKTTKKNKNTKKLESSVKHIHLKNNINLCTPITKEELLFLLMMETP